MPEKQRTFNFSDFLEALARVSEYAKEAKEEVTGGAEGGGSKGKRAKRPSEEGGGSREGGRERDQPLARRAGLPPADAATTERLTTLLTLGCKALHYSGHGHPQCLTFEDGCAGLQPISPAKLRALCSASSEAILS